MVLHQQSSVGTVNHFIILWPTHAQLRLPSLKPILPLEISSLFQRNILTTNYLIMPPPVHIKQSGVVLFDALKPLENIRRDLTVLHQRWAAERAADSVKNEKSRDISSAEQCPVCLDALLAPGSVATRCGHVFHAHCLLGCPTKGQCIPCPMCRRDVSSAELIPLKNGLPPEKSVVELDADEPVAMSSVPKSSNVPVCDLTSDSDSIPIAHWTASKHSECAQQGNNSTQNDATSVRAEIKRVLHALEVAIKNSTEMAKLEKKLRTKLNSEEQELEVKRKNIGKEREEMISSMRKRMMDSIEDQAQASRLREEAAAQFNDNVEERVKLTSERDLLLMEKKEMKTEKEKLQKDRIDLQERLAELDSKERRVQELIKAYKAPSRPSATRPKETFEDEKKAPTSVEESDDTDLAVFGLDGLTQPATVNRPPAPRRLKRGGNVAKRSVPSLGAYVKSRPTVQKPLGAIAKRRFGRG